MIEIIITFKIMSFKSQKPHYYFTLRTWKNTSLISYYFYWLFITFFYLVFVPKKNRTSFIELKHTTLQKNQLVYKSGMFSKLWSSQKIGFILNKMKWDLFWKHIQYVVVNLLQPWIINQLQAISENTFFKRCAFSNKQE